MFSASTSPEKIQLHNFETVASTQDVAKELAASPTDEDNAKPWLAIVSKQQTKGRGTSGRTWIGGLGNVFMTVAIPMDAVPVTITLLPLQIGVLVAERIKKLLVVNQEDKAELVRVKWPNDVLLDDKKVAGTLIESQVVGGVTWLFIGIGVNLVEAPSVPQEGPDAGRTSTAVQTHLDQILPVDTVAEVFAADLVLGIEQWLLDPASTNENVQTKWKALATFQKPVVLRETQEEVTPLDLKEDGQLLVQGADGKERFLVADYLF